MRKKAPSPRRARRSPEEARALILDAADRVFATQLPDAVGLKEIGQAAGVSHALVTHYFKTYAGLVEAALERRFVRLRESMVREFSVVLAGPADAAELLTAYRRTIAGHATDPVTVRLVAWAMMSGHATREDFFSHRLQGLKALADALESRADVSRDDLEFCLVASFALTVVWTVGGTMISGSLGRRAPAADGAFEARVTAMINSYLASHATHARGKTQPPQRRKR